MSILQQPAGFSLAALPWSPSKPSSPFRFFTTAAEFAAYGRSLAICGGELDPAPCLPHSFFAALVQGFRAGRADADASSATLLGQAFGAAGLPPRLPAGYSIDQAEAFRDAWSAADAGRRDLEPTPEDLAAYWGSDHDAQPDPFAVEAWALPNSEYYSALADLDDIHAEARAFVEEEWSHRAARRATAAPITDADVHPAGCMS